jgi:membrane protein implicated in regulation of membrane protease activity
MRQELELAKAELKQEGVKASETLKEEGAKAGKAAGVFGAAGYVGHLAVLFLSLALWYLIASIIDSPGWAFLIVGVLYAIVAGVLASMGKKKMKDVDLSRLKQVNPTPEQTVETLQEVPGALKPSN